MKSLYSLFLSVFISIYSFAQPNADQFKFIFEKQLQQLKPEDAARRTVKFVSVTPGKSNGGYYRFNVTAYIHDYSAGYPRNKYYGQTCVGKMTNWPFDMLKNDKGQWMVQGRFTVSGEDHTCKQNTAEGIESIPLASVPGMVYQPGNVAPIAEDKHASSLYIGEYACYGSGGRLLAGMGFTLLANGTYYDLDKQRGGTYTYNAQQASLSFKGGFLAGQTGKNVKNTGFDLSSTIHCEPWR